MESSTTPPQTSTPDPADALRRRAGEVAARIAQELADDLARLRERLAASRGPAVVDSQERS